MDPSLNSPLSILFFLLLNVHHYALDMHRCNQIQSFYLASFYTCIDRPYLNVSVYVSTCEKCNVYKMWHTYFREVIVQNNRLIAYSL